MLAQLFDFAISCSPTARRFLIRNWFQYLSRLDREALMIFMNLGYASTPAQRAQPLVLETVDEGNRYCIQMYHHVAGAIDLRGLDVLEVGSGRGGGASYVTRYLKPRSMTGVDISANAVAFCNASHSVENLRFLQGDAEALPFDANTFDAVINVESSYGYGHMEAFLSEVYSVLRPGGYFLFTDYRARHDLDTLRQQLAHSGLITLREECISANVVQALDLDNERKAKLIRQRVPAPLQSIFHYFAAMQGSRMYKSLQAGTVDYRFFLLTKPQ